jgi:hypothetical protein
MRSWMSFCKAAGMAFVAGGCRHADMSREVRDLAVKWLREVSGLRAEVFGICHVVNFPADVFWSKFNGEHSWHCLQDLNSHCGGCVSMQKRLKLTSSPASAGARHYALSTRPLHACAALKLLQKPYDVCRCAAPVKRKCASKFGSLRSD